MKYVYPISLALLGSPEIGCVLEEHRRYVRAERVEVRLRSEQGPMGQHGGSQGVHRGGPRQEQEEGETLIDRSSTLHLIHLIHRHVE